MAPFRPNNVNTRRVSSTGGNAGVVGPRTCPFSSIPLGGRCDNLPGKGRFNITESYCVAKSPPVDCKGILVSCDGAKWFIAPACTELVRSWYCRCDAIIVANSCMGSCGWFYPGGGTLQNQGYSCRNYWDSYAGGGYWAEDQSGNHAARVIRLTDNDANTRNKPEGWYVRAFRCI